MRNEITNKQLRSFGLTVGGMFAVIGFWPLFLRGENLRLWALILAGFLVFSFPFFSGSVFLFFKKWIGVGVTNWGGINENYFGCSLLRDRHPDRDSQTLAWKRSHGPPVETRPR